MKVICVVTLLTGIIPAVIAEPEGTKNFTIYWNVPTHLCERGSGSENISFRSLLDELKIVQNPGGKFRGSEFTILYSPGLWPSMEHNKTVNGGMPHLGNLTAHLEKLNETIIKNNTVSANFTGIAVIDMESWRPIFRQNTGWMIVYRNLVFNNITENNETLSKALEEHKNNTKEFNKYRNYLFEKAAEIFEPKAVDFMNTSISVLKELRPNAKWGYYGFPYCFNMGNASHARVEDCPPIVQRENNRTGWLFKAYDYWFPSVYIPKDHFNATERQQLVQGRVKEYNRLREKDNPKAKIFPYIWHLYNLNEESFLNQTDLQMTLETLKKGGMDGAIFWAKSANVNSTHLCTELRNYVNTTVRTVLEKLNIPVQIQA
ncbi:hyaluronidase B-like [Phlebotomus papatasi]|uniref:hyaluronidase B-like n=1 Tax=Phlebotomus papatasi TaxID=29031 RepID=UPI0024845839|nr:hyaluronidase B-like [Phlebotomus papatasi]